MTTSPMSQTIGLPHCPKGIAQATACRTWLRLLTLACGLGLGILHQVGLCDDSKASKPLLSQTAKDIISKTRSYFDLPAANGSDQSLISNQFRALEKTGKKLSVVVKDQLSSGMMTLLKGEGHAGVDRFSEGMSYQAIWSSKYILVEARYQF